MHASIAVGPEPAIRRCVPRVAEARQVVRERVEPYPHDLLRVARHRDSPAARAGARSGGADVMETAIEEALDLACALARLDSKATGREGVTQRMLIPREPEEPVLLLDELVHLAV